MRHITGIMLVALAFPASAEQAADGSSEPGGAASAAPNHSEQAQSDVALTQAATPGAVSKCEPSLDPRTCTPSRTAVAAAERELHGLADLSYGRIRTAADQRKIVENMQRSLASLTDPDEYPKGSKEWLHAQKNRFPRANLKARLPYEQELLSRFEQAEAALSRAKEQTNACEERVAKNQQVCDAELAEKVAEERKREEEAERQREAKRRAEEAKAKSIEKKRRAESSSYAVQRGGGLTSKEKRALEVEMICESQFNKTVQKMEAYCRTLPEERYEFCTRQAWELSRDSRTKCYRQASVEPPNDGLD